MVEYRVIIREVTSVVWRDVNSAAEELAEEVSRALSSGWEAQGGIASVQAGTGVYLLQAVVRTT